MKTRVIVHSALLGIIFLCFSCDQDPIQYNSDIVLDEIESYGLQIVGEPTISVITIPYHLSGPDWGLKKHVCEEGGYELSSYAGKSVFLTSYIVTETCNGEPVNVRVLSREDICICAYKTSNMIPGIFPVDQYCME